MFGIEVKEIKGHRVQLAPNGVEGLQQACIVWTDPNPEALIRYCRVLNENGKVISAKTVRGLLGAARRYGLVASLLDWYVP